MTRAAGIIKDAAVLYAGGTPVDFEIAAETVLAELNALRSDAARYGFIRANGVYHLQFERGECGTGVYLGAAADQAIDEAIKEAKPLQLPAENNNFLLSNNLGDPLLLL